MTTPDRLAAAVAQGHEDAVQVCGNCDGRKCMACVFREVHDACVDTCPDCCPQSAPVSSPAGEDVERVAREEAERLRRRIRAAVRRGATFDEDGHEYAECALNRDGLEAVTNEVMEAIAALSVRPVEAQGTGDGEVERLREARDRWRNIAIDFGAKRDAALARAASAEQERDRLRAGIEAVRLRAEKTADGCRLTTNKMSGRLVALACHEGYERDLRALLAGSGEQSDKHEHNFEHAEDPTPVHEHGDWDQGGYCNRLVVDANGDGDVCGYRLAPVTPDSPDALRVEPDYSHIYWFDPVEGCWVAYRRTDCVGAEELPDAVLAVVREVAAECDHARAARDLVRSYPGSTDCPSRPTRESK